MSLDIKEIRIDSSDNIHKLYTKIYLPDSEPKGIFHIVHGMTEHIGRYDSFMREIAESGYICFGYDNLGHGRTAKDESELGFIDDKNGCDQLAKDVLIARNEIKKMYGENLPYILMGFSMGSFIVRLAAVRYPKLSDKLIVMGTSGPNRAVGAGLAVIELIKLFKSGSHRSKLVSAMIFGPYSRRFEDRPVSWLTKDYDVVIDCSKDKYCMFTFTLSAYTVLLKLTKIVNSRSWFGSFDKELPTLILSGEDDPVGDYSKGIKAVYRELKKRGCKVRMKLYSNCRHEILNDDSREETISDIAKFISD